MSDVSLSGGTVSIPVKPDTTGFGTATEAGMRSQVAGRASGFASIGKSIGVGIGVAAAAAVTASVAAVIHTGFEEALDASAGLAQLDARLKSTGNAAGVSSKALEDLASSLQLSTGQTDDSIVSAESLLLTFTNIKNVGTDKVFDDATRAATNMATAFGGDAASNAVLLGKALNDPIAGVTSLRKIGVSFTDAQRDQIKVMVQSGNTIGAQKLILGELTKETGGAAAAFGKSLPGQLAIAQRSFEDFSQGIVETFIPIVLPILQDVLKVFKDNAPAIQDVATAVAGGLKQAFADASPFIKNVGDFIHDVIAPALGNMLEFIGKFPEVVPAAVVALGALAAAAFVLDVAMDLNPVGAVVVAIEALIVVSALAVAAITTNFGGITTTLTGFLHDVLTFGIGIEKAIAGVFQGLVNGVIDAINTLLGPINFVNGLVGRPQLKLDHVDFTTQYDKQQDTINSIAVGAYSVFAHNQSAKPQKAGAGGGRAMATGGTEMPRPGGVMVRMSEAGRAETVVDTASLNRVAELALGGGRGTQNFYISEVSTPEAVALAVARRMNIRKA